MKLIVAGSRDITDSKMVNAYIDLVRSKINVTAIVSGHSKGVDAIGEVYALAHNIPLEIFPANWNLYGKSAGPKRNMQMAKCADALLVIKHKDSRGSENMRETALKLGLKVFTHNVD